MVKIHKRIRHHVQARKKSYLSLGAIILSAFLIFSAIFYTTRGSTPATSELAFTEYSSQEENIGSIIPASCESSYEHSVDECDACANLDASNYFTDECCTTGSGVTRCGTLTRTCENGGLSGAQCVTCSYSHYYEAAGNSGNCEEYMYGYEVYSCSDGSTREDLVSVVPFDACYVEPTCENGGLTGEACCSSPNVWYNNSCQAPSCANGGVTGQACCSSPNVWYNNSCQAASCENGGLDANQCACDALNPADYFTDQCCQGTSGQRCGTKTRTCANGGLTGEVCCVSPDVWYNNSCQAASCANGGLTGEACCSFPPNVWTGAACVAGCTDTSALNHGEAGACEYYVPKPDLTTDTAFPTTAMQGTSVSLSATVRNQGDASTGSSFNNFIQVATAANGGGTITDLSSASMSTLAAGASAGTSQSYTFTAMGTYSLRACSDKSNRSSSGTIDESNEGNNCGAWTNVTVYGTSGTLTMPATCTIPTENATCPAMISWTTQNATNTVTVERAYSPFGTIPGGTGANASTNVTFSPTGAYTLNLVHDGRILDSKTMSVICESNANWNGSVCDPIPPQIINARITGNRAPNGVLSFECLYSTTYFIVRTEGDTGIFPVNGSYTGPVSVTLSEVGNYAATCMNPWDSATKVLFYSPVPLPPSDLVLSVVPKTIDKSKGATVLWSVTEPSTVCSLRAVAVCEGGRSNCTQERLSEETSINQILTSGTTDANDPYGPGRNMTSAVQTLAPQNNPTENKSLGKRTILMNYTTDFILDCGGTLIKKARVVVSDENEG
jgi:hypothetical protein